MKSEEMLLGQKSRNGFAATTTSTDSQTRPHPFVFGFPGVVLDDATIYRHLDRS
jgi:hypothetical protein